MAGKIFSAFAWCLDVSLFQVSKLRLLDPSVLHMSSDLHLKVPQVDAELFLRLERRQYERRPSVASLRFRLGPSW